MTKDARLIQFPARTSEKIRYSDMDTQGHVNNAVFATYMESARVDFLYDPARPMADAQCLFVVARLEIDFRAELLWPGDVEIGTRICSIGRSSLTLEQALFQNERCVAEARSVIVQIKETTRRAQLFSVEMMERLRPFTNQVADDGCI